MLLLCSVVGFFVSLKVEVHLSDLKKKNPISLLKVKDQP